MAGPFSHFCTNEGEFSLATVLTTFGCVRVLTFDYSSKYIVAYLVALGFPGGFSDDID